MFFRCQKSLGKFRATLVTWGFLLLVSETYKAHLVRGGFCLSTVIPTCAGIYWDIWSSKSVVLVMGLIVVSQNSYVEVLTPSDSEYDCT